VSILGTRVLRTEDPGFLTSGGVYTDDVVDERLAGACHVFFVRSPVAHARIRAIDLSGVRQAPGVVAAFTGDDLAGLLVPAPPMPDINEHMRQPLLARDVVRFVGEPVAVVVTEDPYQSEDAADLVDADYDPLPAVIGLAEAAGGVPGLLFPGAGTNVAASFGDAAKLQPDLFDGCDAVVSAASTSGSRPRPWRPARPPPSGARTAGSRRGSRTRAPRTPATPWPACSESTRPTSG
jgi:carbon-monoxide dehydrogenase large subunit